MLVFLGYASIEHTEHYRVRYTRSWLQFTNLRRTKLSESFLCYCCLLWCILNFLFCTLCGLWNKASSLPYRKNYCVIFFFFLIFNQLYISARPTLLIYKFLIIYFSIWIISKGAMSQRWFSFCIFFSCHLKVFSDLSNELLLFSLTDLRYCSGAGWDNKPRASTSTSSGG